MNNALTFTRAPSVKNPEASQHGEHAKAKASEPQRQRFEKLLAKNTCNTTPEDSSAALPPLWAMPWPYPPMQSSSVSSSFSDTDDAELRLAPEGFRGERIPSPIEPEPSLPPLTPCAPPSALYAHLALPLAAPSALQRFDVLGPAQALVPHIDIHTEPGGVLSVAIEAASASHAAQLHHHLPPLKRRLLDKLRTHVRIASSDDHESSNT